MRIQLLSDLHFEFHRDGGRALFDACQVDDVDVLVLAGDIAVADGIGPALRLFAERYRHVLYVHGNHEFYTSSREAVLAHTAEACAALPNVQLLDCNTVTIAGQRFVGAPLWFQRTEASERYQRALNDFRLIADFRSWVYREHERARSFFESAVEPGDIVVTHHLPSPACVHPKYQDNPLNCFFVADMDEVIRARKPALWMHGHTHESIDTRVGGTRVICNPFGYVRREENPRFEPRLAVER